MQEIHRPHIQRSELHECILNQAITMFQREGIKQVRMDDIASSLSISKRTLYETYRDKEELLLECTKRHKERKDTYMKQVSEEAGNVMEIVLKSYLYDMEELRRINHRFYEDMKKYPTVLGYLKSTREEHFQQIVEFFMRGVDQGIFRSDVNIEIFIRLFTLQCDVSFESDFLQQYPLDETYKTIMLTSMRGIATEKGQQILNDLIHKNNHK